jgi:two-component system, NarL family, response regulator LiaR
MSFLKQIFRSSRHILLYGAAMAVLVFVLKWLQWKYLITDNSLDIYIGLIALFFTFLGVWIANQLTRAKVETRVETVVIEKEVYVSQPVDAVNEEELEKLNLTTREYEVLKLLTQGRSNAEIADSLFLSLSTVKTHVSNLFVKMDVKSRTQAIEKARRLKITL